ncbi:TPA: hypothetical protein QFV56_005947, partial [Klebsiella pneumoniae]|nr:hypothetical protein [Klebsiella pneumoniae]
LKAEGISPERMEWLKKLADMKYCASNPGHWLMSLKETNYLAVVALKCIENNLSLVEALGKAQQVDEELCKLLPPGVEYMDPPDGGDVTPLEGVRRMVADYRQRIAELDAVLEREREKSRRVMSRIAELESRTVTVKQGEVLVTVAGFTGCGKSAIAGEIEIAMKAIGVPVTWVNGDAEKRMTGADWLAAIEMYNPTVRIVEVNIPRAAGIKVGAE